MKNSNFDILKFGQVCYCANLTGTMTLSDIIIPQEILYALGESINSYYGFEISSLLYCSNFNKNVKKIILKPLKESVCYFVKGCCEPLGINYDVKRYIKLQDAEKGILKYLEKNNIMIRVDSSRLNYLTDFYNSNFHFPHHIGLAKSKTEGNVILIDCSPMSKSDEKKVVVMDIELKKLIPAIDSNEIFRGYYEMFLIPVNQNKNINISNDLLRQCIKKVISNYEGDTIVDGVNAGITSYKAFAKDILKYDEYWPQHEIYEKILIELIMELVRYPVGSKVMLDKLIERINWITIEEKNNIHEIIKKILDQINMMKLIIVKCYMCVNAKKNIERLSNKSMYIYNLECELLEHLKKILVDG